MDLRQLRTFVTVADLGTVSKAATRLGIAQPALSRQIKELEADLGLRLFDRIRRRLALTGEGEQLLIDCRNILGATGALTEHAQRLRKPDAGVLKIAGTPQTIDGVLSGFLARYARRRPDVQVQLTEAFGSALPDLVERGEVHFALATAGAIQPGHGALATIRLAHLDFVAAGHPACGLSAGSMDVRGLRAQPLLLLDTSFAVRAAFDAACRVAQFKPNIRFQSRTPHTLLALAEAGHGVAIVPSVMPTHRYKLDVARLTYERSPLREEYGMVWDPRRSLPPAAEDFREALANHVREVLPISRPTVPRKGSAAARAKRRSGEARSRFTDGRSGTRRRP